MSEPASEAFLNGQGIPVPLAEIEDMLAQLWGPSDDTEAKGRGVPATPTRLVLSNLVVVDLGSDPSRIDGYLEVMAERYPSRIVVLRTDGSASGRVVNAEVAAVCHVPGSGRPQVCSEQIILRAPAASYDLLPGAVRRLLIADLPMVLWWSGDPRQAERLFFDLSDESSRLILDLPDPGAEPVAVRLALDLRHNLFDRDIAWFGITNWRELVAQFFDPAGCEAALGGIREVRIAARTPEPVIARPPRVALWLGAWLAGQLGWKQDTRGPATPGHFEASFRSATGRVRIVIETRQDDTLRRPQITAVDVNAGSAGSFQLTREGASAEVLVVTDAPGHDALPRLIRAPEWDTTRRLAAALESARDDPPYRSALPHLLWMLDAT